MAKTLPKGCQNKQNVCEKGVPKHIFWRSRPHLDALEARVRQELKLLQVVILTHYLSRLRHMDSRVVRAGVAQRWQNLPERIWPWIWKHYNEMPNTLQKHSLKVTKNI